MLVGVRLLSYQCYVAVPPVRYWREHEEHANRQRQRQQQQRTQQQQRPQQTTEGRREECHYDGEARQSVREALGQVDDEEDGEAAMDSEEDDDEDDEGAEGVADAVWRVRRGGPRRPKFPAVFKKVMEKDSFWEDCRRTEEMIRPLTYASLVMQRDNNNLADVVRVFHFLFRPRSGVVDPGFAQVLHSRWYTLEHPLLLLAYVLDPRCVKAFRAARVATGCFPLLFVVDVMAFYYKIFFDNDTAGLAMTGMRWLDHALTEAENYAMDRNLWTLLREHDDAGVRKLARLGQFVTSIPVQSATCERLFSEYGQDITKARNRLSPHKAHKLSVVRRATREVHRKQEAVGAAKRRLRILMPTELPFRHQGGGGPALSSVGSDELQLLDCYDDAVVPTREEGDEVVECEAEGADETTAEALLRRFDLMPEDATQHEQQPHQQLEQEQEPQEEQQQRPQLLRQPAGFVRRWNISSELAACRHDDGSDFRARYPLPAADDNMYPQQLLHGVRNLKFRLEWLFPADIAVSGFDDI
eukprot:GHVU01088101.1.p1 GENE.GHVU01088101.1~~GHVU01088101.1.p1  ORF type:complete len:527 (+),score=97.63 GHVU01088101.1:646-2226(+)